MRSLFIFIALGLSQATAVRAAFDVSKYPRAAELTLASMPAEVQPIRSVRVKSPTDGLLTLRLPAAGSRLNEGAIWGEFDPERLQLEAEAVALARSLFVEKEKPKLTLEIARNAADLTERRAELDRQAGMLARIAKDPTLAELYANESSGGASSEEVATLSNQLRNQLTLIDDVLRYIGTPRANALELRALELKLLGQEIEVSRRLQEFRLVMPFEGELSLIPPPPPQGKPLRVPLGADLALVQDFSTIQAVVPLRRSEWRLIDPKKLQLRYSHRGRQGITATFQRSITKEHLGREDLFYIFHFPTEQRTEARALSGGQIAMQLVLTLNETACIIPKIDLILAAPAAFRDQGWDGGVETVIPGARLLAQGETHLAIAVPSPAHP
ncbi:MAG: hypothetical protein ABW223_05110 [Rariglobus sp.]